MIGGLDGFRLLVTGGGSGIGRAIALGAVEAGCRVAIAAVHPEGMAAVVAAAHGPGEVSPFTADVTDGGSVERLVDGCVARFGGLDGLVSCAGILHLKPSIDVTDAEFERVLSVNLMGAFRVTREVGRVMLAAGSGSIVEIGSLSSFGGFPGRLAYSVSKAGVAVLNRTLCAEWGRRGVRVNALAPGFVHTPIQDRLIAEGEFDVRAIEARTPMGRRAEPEDMVEPALFLLSDASRFINGHLLAVDGGWLALVGQVDRFSGVDLRF